MSDLTFVDAVVLGAGFAVGTVIGDWLVGIALEWMR